MTPSEQQSICQKCGKCCVAYPIADQMWDTISPDFALSQDKRDWLDRNVKKFQQVPNACKMLIIEDGNYACLIQKYFGRDSKPKVCVQYKCNKIGGTQTPPE